MNRLKYKIKQIFEFLFRLFIAITFLIIALLAVFVTITLIFSVGYLIGLGIAYLLGINEMWFSIVFGLLFVFISLK